jgi:hypothetical protein
MIAQNRKNLDPSTDPLKKLFEGTVSLRRRPRRIEKIPCVNNNVGMRLQDFISDLLETTVDVLLSFF